MWFDLSTKVRALVSELVQPVVDKVHDHKDLLGNLRKETDKNIVGVDQLERTVYNKDNKISIFEEIFEKIAKVEAERRTVESKLINDHELILRTFKDHEFKFDNNQRQLKTMITSNQDALAEMIELKESITLQNTAFRENLE